MTKITSMQNPTLQITKVGESRYKNYLNREDRHKIQTSPVKMSNDINSGETHYKNH